MAVSRPVYIDRIVQDPEIMVGKPIVRGTRITVEAVLDHLAANPDLDDLFAAYPRLTIDDLKAVLAFAGDQVRRQKRRGAA
ncbi:MAG: DUF433 domain-containing protein [Chloroflexi bacterium]|nr:DUF433 domain-containing protein [Chloroflexota bacterium]